MGKPFIRGYIFLSAGLAGILIAACSGNRQSGSGEGTSGSEASDTTITTAGDTLQVPGGTGTGGSGETGTDTGGLGTGGTDTGGMGGGTGAGGAMGSPDTVWTDTSMGGGTGTGGAGDDTSTIYEDTILTPGTGTDEGGAGTGGSGSGGTGTGGGMGY
ncbi:MAG TPA: hypothetical protein VK465_13960 [Fibrobacteria bacterium]|nr:hypothetical protein [Fibrobacteria bacterium]